MRAGVALSVVFLVAGRAAAAEYYVAPDGSDSAAGTLAAPFATLRKGNDVASAGDTVWIRGGTYHCSTQIRLSKSGQSDMQRIKYWAYEQEVPIFDFSTYVDTNTGADVPQILVTGNWLHLRGLEIANGKVGASGNHSNSALRSEGASNNIFELLNIHHNFGPGLFISKGTGGNLILNCDSHDNYDKNGSQGDGQNADGFGVHYQESGPSTIIRGCRAWSDSDDGYDLISQEVPVIIEDSWAFQNGYANGGSVRPADGNGNGFKAGSSKTGIRHLIQNCVAWDNRASGFYANHSSGGNDWFNNTSYNNETQYDMLASTWDAGGNRTDGVILTGNKAHHMRNNIGFPNKNSNMEGVDTSFNTWDLGISETSADFASTSDTGSTGPRQADGSLPRLDFLRLKEGSPLVDKGTDVMLPYVGEAPDLGAYEYGAGAPTDATSSGSSSGGATSGANVTSGGANASGVGGASTAVGGANDAGATTGGSSAGGASAADGTAITSGGASTGTSGGITGVSTGAPGAGGSTATGTSGTAVSNGGSALGTGGTSLVGGDAAPDAAGDEPGCTCSTPRRGNNILWRGARLVDVGRCRTTPTVATRRPDELRSPEVPAHFKIRTQQA